MSQTVRSFCIAALVALAAGRAGALINPNFTPVHLVDQAGGHHRGSAAGHRHLAPIHAVLQAVAGQHLVAARLDLELARPAGGVQVAAHPGWEVALPQGGLAHELRIAYAVPRLGSLDRRAAFQRATV